MHKGGGEGRVRGWGEQVELRGMEELERGILGMARWQKAGKHAREKSSERDCGQEACAASQQAGASRPAG